MRTNACTDIQTYLIHKLDVGEHGQQEKGGLEQNDMRNSFQATVAAPENKRNGKRVHGGADDSKLFYTLGPRKKKD